MKYSPPTLVVHGGAGTILRSRMKPEKEVLYRQGLEEAVTQGRQILLKGGTALGGRRTGRSFSGRQCPFHAGKGAVYAGDGKHYLDASIMQGHDLKAGSIAGVKGIRNPIGLARRVMEASQYVMMMGAGAEDFRPHPGP